MNMDCAALVWDKTRKDYIECDLRNPIQMVRMIGIVTVQLPLCDAHRRLFEEEFASFGGHLDTRTRVEIVNG